MSAESSRMNPATLRNMPDRDDIPPCPPLTNPPLPPGHYRIRTSDPNDPRRAARIERMEARAHLYEIPEDLREV